MMRRRCIRAASLAAALLLSTAAFAQEAAETEVPEVRLPDMNEEARSVAPNDVDAPLPASADLPMPSTEPPLPAERELAIPEDAYRTETTLDTSPRAALGETFTEASVGAGLWDGISANLSIYRPGSDPSFSMTFAHDSLDGFAFREAGSGYYERRTALSGRVRGALSDADSWGFSGAFSDEASGLQGQSVDFYGVSYRYLDLLGTYKRGLGSLFKGALETYASVDFGSASRAFELATASPSAGSLGVDELSVSPKAGISLSYRTLALRFDGEYDFRGLLGLSSGDDPADRMTHRGRADLSAQWDVSSALGLKAALGFASSTSFPVLVPFSLSVDAGLGELASLSVDGGLKTETVRYADAWKDIPYLDVVSLPQDDARWYAGAKLDFFLVPGLTARAAADWAMSLPGGGRIAPEWTSGTDRALYSFSVEEYDTLQSSLGFRWVIGGASLSASWDADWLDAPVVGDDQRFKADIEYRERNEAFGGAVSSTFGLSGGSFSVPVLDASGFVRLSPEIRFIAEFRDIAAAFSGEDGRVRWAPYLTSGFQASARILISL